MRKESKVSIFPKRCQSRTICYACKEATCRQHENNRICSVPTKKNLELGLENRRHMIIEERKIGSSRMELVIGPSSDI